MIRKTYHIRDGDRRIYACLPDGTICNVDRRNQFSMSNQVTRKNNGRRKTDNNN